MANLVVPRISSAGHRPETGDSDTSFAFHASYYDAGGDPSSIDVVIDGDCNPMAPELGAAGNRAYVYTTPLDPGCHEYYFLAVDAANVPASYPEAGAFVMSVEGDEPCPDASDWHPTRIPSCG